MGLPQNVEQSDLVSYGMFGLIDAIDKFEPERGYKFETYAISRIKGSILDELRSIDWSAGSVRAKVRQIERACAKLGPSTTGHRPTRSWRPSCAGLDDQLQTALNQIANVGLAALDEILTGSGERGESITPRRHDRGPLLARTDGCVRGGRDPPAAGTGGQRTAGRERSSSRSTTTRA